MGRPLTILGINAAYCQSSAALIRNNRLVAAVEEERFNRIPHAKEAVVDNTVVLPFSSIDYCLEESGASLGDVDLVGYSFDIDDRRSRRERLLALGPVLPGGYKTEEGERRFDAYMNLAPDLLTARYDVPRSEVWRKFRFLDHHLCHMASAYYASPFDDAAVLVVDGIGEGETATLGFGRGNELEVIEQVGYPHSLGFVWEILTTFLGFRGNYDECKVMGLAAYGDPARFRRQLSELIEIPKEGLFRTMDLEPPKRRQLAHGDFFPLERFFGIPHRLPYEPLKFAGESQDHADLAAALQVRTEEVLLHLVHRLRSKVQSENLALAGGVALNCVANGRLAEEGPFKRLWVQPAAGDAGTSLGAALLLQCHPEPGVGVHGRRVRMPHPYLGPEFSDAEISRALQRFRLVHRRVEDPATEVGKLLAEPDEHGRPRIVGWFQGRLEYGPRALGNRCLLADPRDPNLKGRLNERVKHRDNFRPFCPTILAEHADEWLEHLRPLADAARYMLATYPIKPERREEIPAVIHVDGSSRAQVLRREENPAFHSLISKFYELTGIPMVLNTSFNDCEPIVCTPQDAARCFLKTEFSAMALGHYLVEGPKPWLRSEQYERTYDEDTEAFGRLAAEMSGLGSSRERIP